MKRIPLFTGYMLLISLLPVHSEDNLYRIRISGEEGYKKMAEDLISENPPPGSKLVIFEDDSGKMGETPDAVIEIDRSGFLPPDKAEASTDAPLLDIMRFAPAADFLTERSSCTMKEIQEGKFPLLPLEDIRLPQKALACEGTYPDSPEYPLVEKITLTLKTVSQGPEKGTLEKWFRELPEPIREAPRLAWIGAVGDIMPGRGVDSILLSRRDGLETIFGDTLPVLRKQDLMIGNLETTATESTRKTEKSYNFRVAPRVLEKLGAAGFDFFSITNNHSWDYGETGFLDTLKNLNSFRLATSGAGRNLAEASLPWTTHKKGQKISILSLGAYPREANGFDGKTQAAAGEEKPGILWADMRGKEDIEKNFGGSSSGWDILYVHGGHEWETRPREEQKELYRGFIDRGADIVIGSHPHVLQGMEVYRGKLIFYSLGNFIFPGMEETRYGEDSLIVSIGIWKGKVRYLRLIPVRINNRTIALDKSGRILKRFLALSERLREP